MDLGLQQSWCDKPADSWCNRCPGDTSASIPKLLHLPHRLNPTPQSPSQSWRPNDRGYTQCDRVLNQSTRENMSFI